MARYQVKGPDGALHVFEGPDGATPDQVVAAAQQMFGAQPAAVAAPTQPQSMTDKALSFLGNAAAGAVRGAGSIGATVVAPYDMAMDALDGKGLSLASNQQRRADMDASLRDFGADTNSLAYKGGKLAGEVAGTAGTGGLLANGARAVGAAPALVDAIATGGMAGGNPLIRAAGGAITGGASAGLVDPQTAGAGALIGGVLPGAVQLAGKAGTAIYDAAKSGTDTVAKKLMQSAIKPTMAQRASGDADTAVQTLLDYGISPTRSGVNKIEQLIEGKNQQISDAIKNSNATIDKGKVLQAVDDVRNRFTNQVSPTGDLNAIQSVADDFAAHPAIIGNDIPVAQAQKLKQGTYSVLSNKYGEVGSAETEAQKGLARGLKDEIATAVPEVGPLNAEESRLLTTLSVAERRALLEANKNPVGLTMLAHNPIAAAAFMADRSAAFKALAARMINRSVPVAGGAGQAMLGATSNPLLRTAGLEAISASP